MTSSPAAAPHPEKQPSPERPPRKRPLYRWSRLVRYRIRQGLFNLSKADREETYREVRDSHQMRPAYLMMLTLASLIAVFGLLGNSPAVVIGAMLISPLMNPFLSAGLALAIGDWPLGRAALRTIALSVLAAVSITVAAVAASPLKAVTPEILARTHPNLLDLGIAFFSGFAGTFTLISRKGGTTIPGVAIATAVVPPLCVTGFGIYALDWGITAGAFSLFLTNLAAIIVSAATVFLLASFRASDRPGDRQEHWAAPVRLLVSFGCLGLLSIPLAVALVQAAEMTTIRGHVEAALLGEVERDPERARLNTGWSVREKADGGFLVEAMARTTRYFDRDEVIGIERAIERAIGRRAELRLEQVRVHQGGLEPEPEVSAASALGPQMPAPPPPQPTIEEIVRDFRPAAALAAAALGAELDQYRVVAGESGITGLELDVRRAELPSLEARTAAGLAAREWLQQEGLVETAPPAVRIRVHPSEPVDIEVEASARRRPPAPEVTPPGIARARAFLEHEPTMRVRVLAGEPTAEQMAIDPSAPELRAAVARALAIPESRIAEPAAGEPVLEVRIAPLAARTAQPRR